MKSFSKLSLLNAMSSTSLSSFKNVPDGRMPIKQSNILLLTATITPPPGTSNLSRIDPCLRLQDYERALKFYLSLVNQCVSSIIFAENSNTDVSSLRNLTAQYGVTDQVEFIVFDGLDYPPSYDRGYGELKLVDYVMNHSEIIKNEHNGEMIIWKVTGRYIVRNLPQIIAQKPSIFDLYCNFRNFPKRWFDMYLFAWTLSGYQACLNGAHHKIETDVAAIPARLAVEELLRNFIEQTTENIKLVRRFNVTPEIEGIRGGDNKGYSTDHFWKFYLRNTLHILFPWLWI